MPWKLGGLPQSAFFFHLKAIIMALALEVAFLTTISTAPSVSFFIHTVRELVCFSLSASPTLNFVRAGVPHSSPVPSPLGDIQSVPSKYLLNQ